MNPYDIGPILRRMTGAVPGAGDIIFSPHQVPFMIKDGKLVPAPLKDLRKLTPYQTEMLALNLLRDRPRQMAVFAATGSVSFSLTLRKVAHFRVSVFKQREAVALTLRIVPLHPPTLDSLGLPKSLTAISELRSGLVVFSGPSGCGKSTTLAAAVQQLNQAYPRHIISVEKPIEFVYSPERSLIHQREVGSDCADFKTAIEAAMKQSARVLVVSEIDDAATAEAALSAAEAGLLVLTTTAAENTFAALHALFRMIPKERVDTFRYRLSAALKFMVSQKLFPRQNGSGRIAALEILKMNNAIRDYLQQGAPASEKWAQLIRQGEAQGMQLLATDVERLVKEEAVAPATVEVTAAKVPASMPVTASDEPLLELEEQKVLDMNLTT